ncbi:hypothetical protein HZB90_00350 [archaeon]|nr:hypothetical protein [archaeon]
MRKRKSQMEIMGLMVVVILVIVGVLFAVKFVVLKKPSEVKQTYSRTQMASNFGLALMSSTTKDCRDTAIKNLLIDCAEWPEAGGTITCDDEQRSCEYVNATISTLLDNTMTKWNRRYYVMAGTSKRLDEQIIYHHNLGCTADKTVPGESESFFLPTNRGLLTLKIFICE